MPSGQACAMTLEAKFPAAVGDIGQRHQRQLPPAQTSHPTICSDIAQGITPGAVDIAAIRDPVTPLFITKKVDVERVRSQATRLDSRLLNVAIEPTGRLTELSRLPLLLKTRERNR